MSTSTAVGSKRAADFLREFAAIWDSRNKEYGNNYWNFGGMMMAFFPDGVTLKTEMDHIRFGLIVQLVAKLSRIAEKFEDDGHPDSTRDLAVYAAMLHEVEDDL